MDLDPRKQRIAERASENARLHRIQEIILLYDSLCLAARSEAMRLMAMVASAPAPPQDENTKGVNEPCSTAVTRSTYSRFLAFSNDLKRDARRLGLITIRVGIKHPCVEECVLAIGPEAPHSEVRVNCLPTPFHMRPANGQLVFFVSVDGSTKSARNKCFSILPNTFAGTAFPRAP